VTFITETFEVLTKKMRNFDSLLYFTFRTRLHVHLKKWTLKF